MIIIVTGGRDYRDKSRVWQVLSDMHAKMKIATIMHGACEKKDAPYFEMVGADAFADGWARYHGVDRILYPANWTGRGGAGGPIRNKDMLDLAVLLGDRAKKRVIVVAFPGGKGTRSMCRFTHKQGVTLLCVDWEFTPSD